MLFANDGKKHGRSFFRQGNWQPNKEHNRESLRRVVSEYLFNKGLLKKTYTGHDVAIFGLAPKGQVMFSDPELFEKTLKRLEEQVGEENMRKFEVKIGEEYSETETVARKIVASWK